MSLTDQEIAVLRAIHATDPVSAEDATWAVTQGLAVQAEDGDIDLTPAGRSALDQVQPLAPVAPGRSL
jgi:hypothetical protein